MVPGGMNKVFYACNGLRRAIIRHAIWLYFRFRLSCRNVDGVHAKHGMDAA